MIRAAIFRWLIAIDVWTNAEVLGGSIPGETISSAVGRKSLEGRAWARLAGFTIDRIFWMVAHQKRHCLESIQWELLPSEKIESSLEWLSATGREFVR